MFTRKNQRKRSIFVFVLLFLLTLRPTTMELHAQENEGRVLFISSYSYAWDTVPLQIEGIKESLEEGVILDYAFMDTKYVNDEKSQQLFFDRLKYELEMVEAYDVIIVGDDAALNFALENRMELFPDAAIVFEGINDLEVAVKAGEDPMITGVVEELSYEDNIAFAMQVMPQATQIVAIVDNTITGEGEKKQFYANEKNYPDLAFKELNASELTKEELKEQLSEYGQETILLYLICSEDKDGSTYSSNEVLTIIREHTQIPVFRLVQSGIGEGVLGGVVVSHKESGVIAGTMAQQFLKEGTVEKLPVQMESPNFFYCDAQILEKFEISEDILPKGAVLLNESPTFWEANSRRINHITITTIIILLAIGLIAALAYSKQRSRVLLALEKKNKQLGEAIQIAEHANTAKITFLSRMSHEIRTPMNAILGLTTITRNHIGQPERVSENLDKIEVSSKMLLSIINDVLDMSAIESNKIKIAHVEFDFKQLLTALSCMYYPLCKRKGITFDMVLEDVTKENLIGDQLRVNQILNNLLSNALKFTEQGGVRIEIRQKEVKENDVYMQFVVEDTGCGMSEDMLDRLFKPFEQENSKTSSDHGGSGLGMSITKNLVDLMHGAIHVESEKEKGTKITVSLPFEVAPETKNEEEKKVKRLKVLVVDDDADTREYVSSVLTNMDVEHTTAESGQHALNELKIAVNSGRPFDVCLVDWIMPSMNGVEVIREIRKLYSKKMLLIITSAYDLNEIETDAKQAGVDLFLPKPLFQSTIFNLLMGLSGGAYTRRTADEKFYDFNGKRILLVDDTEFNLDVAVDLLEMVNLKVTCARNGQEAVDAVTNAKPGEIELILMDIQMPVLDGHEATRRIRALNQVGKSDIPILAMTANAFAEDIAASLDAGMNDHITKPIDTKTLYLTIDKYLAR